MGVGSSKSSNTINNLIQGSVESIMESSVRGDVNVACSNAQVVEGARGCNIEFSDQICEAVGISNMTSNSSLDATLSQDVMSQISSQAAATTEGMTLQLAQLSDSSNVVNSEMNMAMETTQSFTTSCTRNVSAINLQSVKDCDSSTVKFAPQMVSASVIGDCVSSQVGALKASQTMSKMMDLTAEATTKGVDMWAMVMMMAGFFVIFILGGPTFFFGMRYAMGADVNNQTPQMIENKQQLKLKFYAIGLLGFFMLLVAVLWWPGVFSIYLGISPWPYIGVNSIGNKVPLCRDGHNIDPEVFINTWMWYDPHCASQKATTFAGEGDGQGLRECSVDDKVKRYEGCGLFAKTLGCDDPAFKADEASYIATLEACGDLGGATFSTCAIPDIAVEVFSQEDDDYGSCHRCDGTSEEQLLADPRANYGLWAGEGKDCASGLDPTVFMRTPGAPCGANEPNCKESEEALLAASQNACTNEAYQMRKRRFASYWEACERVQRVAQVTLETEGEMPSLGQQCPPNPFQYFSKCRGSDKKCSYNAVGCVCDAAGENCDCSNADPHVVASCRNDLEGCCSADTDGNLHCLDPAYQQDLMVWQAANDTCQLRHASRNWFNPWGWIIPLLFYILGFIFMAYILLNNPAMTAGMGQMWNRERSPRFSKMTNIVIIGFLVLGIGASASMVYVSTQEDLHEGMDSFNPDSAKTGGSIGTGVGVLLLLAFVGYQFMGGRLRTPGNLNVGAPAVAAPPANPPI